MQRLRSNPGSIVVYLVWVQQRLCNVKDNVSEDLDCFLYSSVCHHRINMGVSHLGVSGALRSRMCLLGPEAVPGKPLTDQRLIVAGRM